MVIGPDHVRHSVDHRGSGEHAGHCDAPLDGDAGFVPRSIGEGVLGGAAPGCVGQEAVVARSGVTVGDHRREVADHVHPVGTVPHQSVPKVGQLRFEQMPHPGVQVVGLPELGDTAPIPGFPGILDRAGDLLRVALQHPDRVAVPGQQHRRGQTADPTAQHQYVTHGFLLRSRPVGVPRRPSRYAAQTQ